MNETINKKFKNAYKLKVEKQANMPPCLNNQKLWNISSKKLSIPQTSWLKHCAVSLKGISLLVQDILISL